MDTAPLPAVPADPDGPPGPTPRHGAPGSTPRHGVPGAARGLEILAGLASGGLVVLGLGLVVLQLVAPEIAPGSGVAAAEGPTWGRALAQLGVGVLGELAVWARPRMTLGPRVWIAVAVLVAAAAVLWFCWWR